jgi:hypothetical protein
LGRNATTVSRAAAFGALQYVAHSAIKRRRFSNKSPRRYAASTLLFYSARCRCGCCKEEMRRAASFGGLRRFSFAVGRISAVSGPEIEPKFSATGLFQLRLPQ